MANERQIFREKSLEKLSSPDRLDQLLRVVRPHSWLALCTIGAGMVLVVVWGIFGSIPSTAQGSGILVRPKVVVPFQAPIAGRIASVRVEEGDVVQAGDLLAQLDLPTLREQLVQAKAKRDEFREQSGELTELELARARQEKEHITAQRELIAERLTNIREAAERFKQASDASIAQQRANLVAARKLSEELGGELQGRYEVYRDLSAENRVPADQVVNVHASVIENQLRLAELDVKAEELDLSENEAQETYDGKLDQIASLEVELVDLELQELLVDQRLRADELSKTSEAQDLERTIARLETQLEEEGRVLSEGTGRVLEVSAAPGQQVSAGQLLGRMEIEDVDSDLMALAYLPVEDGKRVEPGAKIRISPATVERERHGSMLGTIERVSDYPVTVEAAGAQIGDAAIAQRLLAGESRIEVLCRLGSDPDTPTGFAWTSGEGPDDVVISAGTTALVRVTIDEQAPIELVLPFLKSMTDT